jgi:hypothetical protein
VHARQRSPPPARRSANQTTNTPPVLLPQLWAQLPVEHRRRLSQLMARIIARQRLFLSRKEVSDD